MKNIMEFQTILHWMNKNIDIVKIDYYLELFGIYSSTGEDINNLMKQYDIMIYSTPIGNVLVLDDLGGRFHQR